MDGIINQAVYCPKDYPKKKKQLVVFICGREILHDVKR